MDLERYSIEHWRPGDEALPFAVIDPDRFDSPGGLPPFPVIAFGTIGEAAGQAVDVFVDDDSALLAVAENIAANPQAAAVTVQLLRLVERLPLGDAQLAESLAYGVLQGGAEHARWLAGRSPSSPSVEGRVKLERDGNCLAITLDRPQARNAIDRAMRDSLREAFDLAVLDDTIARIALRGAGKAFCVGAELGEFGTTRDPAFAHAIRMATLPAHAIARVADRLDVHIQGACVGAGLEMAAYAHRITATSNAWFQLPELAMGLLPGAGGSVSVSRRIGRHRAGWMMLSGRRVSASAALGWGLIDALVDD